MAVVKPGKQRVYRIDAAHLKTVHDWVKPFEQLWDHHLARIKALAERRAQEQTFVPNPQQQKGPS